MAATAAPSAAPLLADDSAQAQRQWLLAAYALYAWRGWTLDQALANPLRSRLLKARANKLRADDYKTRATRTVATVRRYNPATGAWVTQRVAGAFDDAQAPLAR